MDNVVYTKDSKGVDYIRKGLIDGTLEELIDPYVTTIYSGAFNGLRYLKQIYFPNVTEIKQGAFAYLRYPMDFNFHKIFPSFNSKEMPDVLFNGSASLTLTINDPEYLNGRTPITSVHGSYSDKGSSPFCGVGKKLIFYSLTDPSYNSMKPYWFYGTAFETIYLPDCQMISRGHCFDENNYFLKNVIIGTNNPTEIVSLSSVKSVAPCTYFANNDVDNVYNFYVPDELLEEYKTATNWSTISERIFPISSYKEIDDSNGYITDSWGDIIQSCLDGTYLTKYNIGDKKLLETENGWCYMVYRQSNYDDMENGEKTSMTFISDRAFDNSPITRYFYYLSDTLEYLSEDDRLIPLTGMGNHGFGTNIKQTEYFQRLLEIQESFPSELLGENGIKTVLKTTEVRSISQNDYSLVSEQIPFKVYPLSRSDLTAMYSSSDSKLWSKIGTTNTSDNFIQTSTGINAIPYWLRDATNRGYDYVQADGSGNGSIHRPSYNLGIVFGFSI